MNYKNAKSIITILKIAIVLSFFFLFPVFSAGLLVGLLVPVLVEKFGNAIDNFLTDDFSDMLEEFKEDDDLT